MATLDGNRWGKSDVRVSKIHRGDDADSFSDVNVQVLLEGDVEAAHTNGDNSSVLPTDTMRNTIYGLAQEYLGQDLERFGEVLCATFLNRSDVHKATVTLRERSWARQTSTGFIGGGAERRVGRVVRGSAEETGAGIEGLVVLKTRGSAFTGFPRDQFTVLSDAEDRLLATSVTANWIYSEVPSDTTATWGLARRTIIDHFFTDWSASVQHQGYLMAEAVLAEVKEISEISFHLPNQHHLPFDLTRFGIKDEGIVFHPVSEPYGDIALTVTRD